MCVCLIFSNVYIQGNSSSKIDLFLLLETRGETHTLLTEIFMEAALHGLQHMMSEVECITSGSQQLSIFITRKCRTLWGEPEQATSLMGEVIHQVNHPPTCISIYHSKGALKVFWFTNLSWHIIGFVTKLIVKF